MAIDSTRLQRHVQLDALANVREVGGYTGRAGQTVRGHRLYRADDLSRATPGDLTALSALGIRTVIDLRTHREVRACPPARFPGAPVDRRHLPMVRDAWRPGSAATRRSGVASGGPAPAPSTGAAGSARSTVGSALSAAGAGPGAAPTRVDDLVEHYTELLVEGAPVLADVLAILATPSAYPVLVHSTLGKDRTGVVIAVVLGLLAVRDEAIVDDYAESEALLGRDPAARLPAFLHDPMLLADAYAGAPPEAMAQLLVWIRERARSMVGFARSIGVPFETVEALHTNLLS